MKKMLVILTIVILSLFIIGCNETMVEETKEKTLTEEKTETVPEALEESIEEPVLEETEKIKEIETEAPIEPEINKLPETAEEEEEERVIIITGENYKFMVDGEENPEIKVKVGEKIKIEFTSTEGFHDFVIDELEAKTEKLTAGESTSIEFTADQAGTFQYYCSVGNHRGLGMEGNFIVE